jgi:hypothetical protein
MNETHTQCLLVTDEGAQYVAWIPTVRASLKRLRIDGKTFNVAQKFGTMDSRDALANSTDYRSHRKATDLNNWKKLNWDNWEDTSVR